MATTPLLQRLDGLDARFEEIGTLITDPAVIADKKRYVKLSKEYKDLERLLASTARYRKLLADIDGAKQLLETENDEELRQMAREELDAATAELPRMEEEIKLLLIPEDPEDGRNAIVEIRGGTGGDEAALFAGDLFRMYAKYCESKGWRVEVSSTSEGAAGGYKEIIFTVSGEGCTACSACLPPRRRAACTRRQHRWPCCPRPNHLTWKSTRAKSSGTLSAAAVPAGRT